MHIRAQNQVIYKTISSPGIELDFRRYITALLAALHLANVTSQQQQQEEKENQPQNNVAEPAPPSPQTPPKNPQESAPTTANKVKSTPESKSLDDSN